MKRKLEELFNSLLLILSVLFIKLINLTPFARAPEAPVALPLEIVVVPAPEIIAREILFNVPAAQFSIDHDQLNRDIHHRQNEPLRAIAAHEAERNRFADLQMNFPLPTINCIHHFLVKALTPEEEAARERWSPLRGAWVAAVMRSTNGAPEPSGPTQATSGVARE
jgi:hypothetical protein